MTLNECMSECQPKGYFEGCHSDDTASQSSTSFHIHCNFNKSIILNPAEKYTYIICDMLDFDFSLKLLNIFQKLLFN